MPNTEEIKKTVASTITRLDTELRLLDSLKDEIREFVSKRAYFGKEYENKINLLTFVCTISPYLTDNPYAFLAAMSVAYFTSGIPLMLSLGRGRIRPSESTESIASKTKALFPSDDRNLTLFGISLAAEYESRQKFKNLYENLALASQYNITQFEGKKAYLVPIDAQMCLSDPYLRNSSHTFAVGFLSFLAIALISFSLRSKLANINIADGISCADKLLDFSKSPFCQTTAELIAAPFFSLCKQACTNMEKSMLMLAPPAFIMMWGGIASIANLEFLSRKNRYISFDASKNQFALFNQNKRKDFSVVHPASDPLLLSRKLF